MVGFVYLIGVDHIKNRRSLQHHLCIQYCLMCRSFSYPFKFTVHYNLDQLFLKNPDFEADKLTEVEVTFVAFDLIDSSIVKQLKAVKGAVLKFAKTHPSLQSATSRDARAGTGRQSCRLGSFLKSSHGDRFSAPSAHSKLLSPSNFRYMIHVYMSHSISCQRPVPLCYSVTSNTNRLFCCASTH